VVYTSAGGSKRLPLILPLYISNPEVIISANANNDHQFQPGIDNSIERSRRRRFLFTFALDRNFSTIVQAEGSNNILFLDPALLAGGDNWITDACGPAKLVIQFKQAWTVLNC
jgi:hypothetical protein